MTFRKGDLYIKETHSTIPDENDLKILSSPIQTKPIKSNDAISFVESSVPELLPFRNRFSEQSVLLSTMRIGGVHHEPYDRIDRLPDPPTSLPWRPTQPPFPQSPNTSAKSSTIQNDNKSYEEINRKTPKGLVLSIPNDNRSSLPSQYSPRFFDSSIKSPDKSIISDLTKSPINHSYHIPITDESSLHENNQSDLPWYMYSWEDLRSGKYDDVLSRKRNPSVDYVRTRCEHVFNAIIQCNEQIEAKSNSIKKHREQIKLLVKLSLSLDREINGFKKCQDLYETIGKNQIKENEMKSIRKNYTKKINDSYQIRKQSEYETIEQLAILSSSEKTSALESSQYTHNTSNPSTSDSANDISPIPLYNRVPSTEPVLVEDVFPDMKSKQLTRIKSYHEKKRAMNQTIIKQKQDKELALSSEQSRRKEQRKKYFESTGIEPIHSLIDDIITSTNNLPSPTTDGDIENLINQFMN